MFIYIYRIVHTCMPKERKKERGKGREKGRNRISERQREKEKPVEKEGERERERSRRKRRKRREPATEKGGRTLAKRDRRGGRIRRRVGRRVVELCSHGSSLGTAVQYAGQGKVTLLCVCARLTLPTNTHPPLSLSFYTYIYTIYI